MSKCALLAFIQTLTLEFSLPKDLIPAVIQQESNWDNTALSHKGARGLMQITPIAVKDILNNKKKLPDVCGDIDEKKVFKDEKQNILAGMCYMQLMVNTHDYIYPLAIAAYNCGPDRVKNIPWPKETRDYIKYVMRNMKQKPWLENLSCKETKK